MCPILDGYGVMTVFISRTRPRVKNISQLAGSRTPLAYLDTFEECGEGGGVVFAWRARSSQPSGSLCCGRRWRFRKPASSTDKFKLKIISRS